MAVSTLLLLAQTFSILRTSGLKVLEQKITKLAALIHAATRSPLNRDATPSQGRIVC